MRLSHDIPCRFARFVFTLTLAYAWAGGANDATGQPPAPATQPPPDARTPEQRAAAAQQFDRSTDAIADAARQMPRDTFDVQWVAQRLGNEPVKLFEWVRDHTAWVPYRGALRGEVGVLMDRLGNSLDRALLLAAMLKASGQTVRLAHGQIPAGDTGTLLTKIRTVPQLNASLVSAVAGGSGAAAAAPATGPAGDPLDDAARKYGVDARSSRAALQSLAMYQQRLQEAMAARLATQVPVLVKLLDQKPEGDPRAALDANRAAAASTLVDHWWVQCQQPDQSWQDLDPLLPDAAPGMATGGARAAETFLADQLPAEQFQQVEIRVVVEQRDGAAAKESTLLRHALQPSKLIGTTVTVGCVPTDWPEIKLIGEPKVLDRVKAAALAQTEWAPMLRIGSDTIIQSSVTASGNVIEKPVLMAQKRAGKGVGSAGLGASDLLSADPAPPPKASSGELTAQWLEYEIRVPNEPPQVVRREIFDLVGAAARAKGGAAPLQMTDQLRAARALGVLAQTEVCLVPCRLAQQYLFHRFAADLQANRATIKAMLDDGGDDPAAVEKRVREFQPMLGDLHMLAVLRDQPQWTGGHLFYNRPVVLTQRGQLRDGAPGEVLASKAFDVVSNAMGVYHASPLAPSLVRLVQGVTDTNAEALLFGQQRRSGNAADELARSEERGDEWIVLTEKGDARLVNSGLPGDAQSRIERDLADGYRVLCPRQAGNPLRTTADATWWRVDPRTGDTLGFNGSGWGASAVEWIAVAMLVGFTAGLLGCMFAMTSGGGAMTGKDVQTCIGVALICAALAGVAMLAIELAAAGAAAGGAAAAGGGAAGGGAAGGGAAGGGAAGGGAAGGGAAGGAAGGGAAGGGAAGGTAGGGAAGGAAGGGAAGGAAGGAGVGGGVSPLAGTISPSAGTFGGGAIGAGAGGAVVEGGGFVVGGAFGATGGAAGGVVAGGGAAGGGALAATEAGGAAAAGTGGTVGAFTGGSGGGTLLILP